MCSYQPILDGSMWNAPFLENIFFKIVKINYFHLYSDF